jgi:hypothetical protein
VYSLLADAILVVHLAFVLFVALGGLLVLRWHWLAWVHVPAVLWGAFIELSGGICPLTPLENTLRDLAGQAGYQGGFIDHYLTSWIYPDGLTRSVQISIGIAVLALNLAVYGYVFAARRRA